MPRDGRYKEYINPTWKRQFLYLLANAGQELIAWLLTIWCGSFIAFVFCAAAGTKTPIPLLTIAFISGFFLNHRFLRLVKSTFPNPFISKE